MHGAKAQRRAKMPFGGEIHAVGPEVIPQMFLVHESNRGESLVTNECPRAIYRREGSLKMRELCVGSYI